MLEPWRRAEWRRRLALLLVIAASVWAVGAGSASAATGPRSHKLPFCPPEGVLVHYNLCWWGMKISLHTGHEVIVTLRSKTMYRFPQAYELKATLSVHEHGKWLEEDRRTYGKGALAQHAGNIRTLTPELKAGCRPGRTEFWQLTMTESTISSSGHGQHLYYRYPGKRASPDWFFQWEKPIKSRWGIRVACP